MAEGCSIPCNARVLNGALRGRIFQDELYNRRRVILGGILLGILSPVVILVAPPVTAVVLACWGFLGAAAVVAQAWLATAVPAARMMPEELVNLVDQNQERIFPPRFASLRARAAALDLDQPNFATFATRLLLDLQETTGEAWRCNCRERKSPLPIPIKLPGLPF